MTDTANHNYGTFTPLVPSFIRLLAGVVVLLVVEFVVLSFPGIQQNASGTSFSYANLAAFFIGSIVSIIILKFGTDLSNAATQAYKKYKTWTPLLPSVFQVLAIIVLYLVSNALTSSYFANTPWMIPLAFLLLALIPTLRAVLAIIHAVEAPATGRHTQN